jgi:NADP-dependent 3-hydroxy acid dehydrogenase YdfG
MTTIFITGTSSGLGKATAEYFQQKGWNVAATMRKPEKEKELNHLNNVKCLRGDVLDVNSIKQAIDDTIKAFGGIDVILNNAGYGAVGPFEAAAPDQIKRQFDTNVFGVMNVIKEILPHFRQRKNGLIINITSLGGLMTFPIYSLYHGTKWAIEGFSESLQYELKQFNIRVKLIEPGVMKTDFYTRSQDILHNENLRVYDSILQKIASNSIKMLKKAADPEQVAKIIYKAATDKSDRLRYLAGSDARRVMRMRRSVPFGWFRAFMNRLLLK